MSRARFWTSFALALPAVRAAARRAQIVHAIKDYPHSLLALAGARLAGRPCVATAHGTYSVQPLLDPRHARQARRLYAGLDALICVSGHTRERIERALGPGGRMPPVVRVIPNAVDAERYAGPPSGAAPRAGRAWDGKPYTLAMGELKERKGHHLSLEAFCRVAPRHPELHHVLIGKRSGDAYERGLLERVRAAGLEGRVHFLGNVPEAEKVALVRGATALVHTPVDAADGGFEGFGIVYLEAGAAGVPSLGTRGSGAEDALEDGVSGLLVAPEAGAVAAGLERLLADPALARRLGAGGRARAARASWEENARAVLALYELALARREKAR
jgi:phosphatidylinositol alpha-1,6-mannosyltransferase